MGDLRLARVGSRRDRRDLGYATNVRESLTVGHVEDLAVEARVRLEFVGSPSPELLRRAVLRVS
jgi:hypothetical protein